MSDDEGVIEKLFEAMAAGPAGEEPMMRLFAEDAVLVETFTGEPREHVGIDSIRRSYRELFREPPPRDMKLVLHRMDRDGKRVRAEWSCLSEDYLEPRRGYDLFVVEGGLIRKLEIVVTQKERRRERESR